MLKIKITYKSNVLHKKVSDKCPQSIKGSLVPHHQNTWIFLFQIQKSSFQLRTPGQPYSRDTSRGNIAKRKEKKIPQTQQVQLEPNAQNTGDFSGIRSTVGVSRPFPPDSIFSLCFRLHSIHKNELTWIMLGPKFNYWQKGYGT